jgi:ATP-dependent DNA ligase
MRAILSVADSMVTILSRSGRDVSVCYPELCVVPTQVRVHDVVRA